MLSFSKLLRKSFASQQKLISIKEEMDMVEEYLELMSLRYKNKFQWKMVIEYETGALGILKNLIQPLVEIVFLMDLTQKRSRGISGYVHIAETINASSKWRMTESGQI